MPNQVAAPSAPRISPEVDGLGMTREDHVDRRRRIADRDSVFAGVVVAGAGRDDAQRNFVLRQCLQRK